MGGFLHSFLYVRLFCNVRITKNFFYQNLIQHFCVKVIPSIFKKGVIQVFSTDRNSSVKVILQQKKNPKTLFNKNLKSVRRQFSTPDSEHMESLRAPSCTLWVMMVSPLYSSINQFSSSFIQTSALSDPYSPSQSQNSTVDTRLHFPFYCLCGHTNASVVEPLSLWLRWTNLSSHFIKVPSYPVHSCKGTTQ